MLRLDPPEGSEKSLIRGSCMEHQTAVTLHHGVPGPLRTRPDRGWSFGGVTSGGHHTHSLATDQGQVGSQGLRAVNEDKTLTCKSHSSSPWEKEIINPRELYTIFRAYISNVK